MAVYEILYGGLRATARSRAALEAVLAELLVIPFDREAAAAAAQVRWELERTGERIGPLDLLLAGTAVSRRAQFVTNNVREFGRVKGLDVIDWTTPEPV